MFRITDKDRNAAAVRRLLKVAGDYEKAVSAAAPGSPAHDEVADAIEDGEYLLKLIGGVAARSNRAAVVM